MTRTLLTGDICCRSIRFQTRSLSWIKRQRVKESEQLLRMRERSTDSCSMGGGNDTQPCSAFKMDPQSSKYEI